MKRLIICINKQMDQNNKITQKQVEVPFHVLFLKIAYELYVRKCGQKIKIRKGRIELKESSV